MLTAMRNGTQSMVIKIVLFGFLIMAMMGMVLTDVGGFFRSGGVGANSVAKAGRENIPVEQFDATLRRTLAQQGMTPKEAYQFGLVDRILQNQISSAITTQAAMDYGFYVGDDEVTRQINMIVDPIVKQQPDKTRRELLQNFLRSQNMGEQEFIFTIRTGIMNSILQSTAQIAGFAPSHREATALYLAQNEARDADILILPHSSAEENTPAEEPVLIALYEASKGLRHAIPETRTLTLATLDEASVRDTLVIPDEDLQKEYDSNIAAYTRPERRVVQQAVLPDAEAAEKAIADVKAGKTLKAATAKNFQGEQSYDRAGLSADIADAVFNAEENAAVGPFKSPFGWSVMVVGKILPEDIKPFDKVRDDIRKQLLQTRISEHLFNTANVIDDRLASGEELESVAADMGLKLEKIGPLREDGSTPEQHDAMKDFAKDRDYILKSAFELMAGESSPVMELANGSYATVRIDDITPRSFKPFEEVRSQIEKEWLHDRRAAANKIRAQEAQQLAASGEKTLAQLAVQYGGKIEKISKLKRNTAEPPKPLGSEAVDAIFAGTEGEFVIAPVPSGYMIGQVKSITLPDPAKITAQEREDLIAAIGKNEREEALQVFTQYLQKDMGAKINRPLLERLYGPESGT